MHARVRYVVAAGLAALALTGCQKKGTEAETKAPDQGPVLATVNGENVTRADVDKLIKADLLQMERQYLQQRYALERQAVEHLADKKLLEAEAKKRGVDQEALLRSEVIDKATPPTEAEVRDFFQKNQAMIQQRAPGAKLEQVAPSIANHLQTQKAQQAELALLKRLRDGAKVDIKLPPPEMPAVEVAATGPAKGPATAPATLVVFSDFQCPFCSQFKQSVDKVVKEYGDKVRVVFRDFPLPNHAQAQKAAEAGRCAAEQNKFWELHDAMFANQDKLAVDGLKQLARTAGLDGAAFDTCLDSGKHQKGVMDDLQAGREAGVNGTPTAFVNGRIILGAGDYDMLKAAIDRELNKKS